MGASVRMAYFDILDASPGSGKFLAGHWLALPLKVNVLKRCAAGIPIHLIGVEFSREQRCVVRFEVESLNNGSR